MTRFGGVAVAAAIAGLLVGVSPEASEAGVRSGPYDGIWSVLIQTVQGACGTYRAALQIYRGQVSSPEGDYAIAGTVSPNGMTAVTVTSNQGSATGMGRLRGASGGGQWRSSSGECWGGWTAVRRQ